ncbi:pectin lyase fold/virulence factor [Aspergillus coremiiformis]|uniref:pectinesterase n=1 Tax=Aspergillus coremiiformis TaxID=138285 RepID=A0A5N6YX26_9EURO|nr:pectin lyase fold/virulence factor [Aspergillus coremiiformis]
MMRSWHLLSLAGLAAAQAVTVPTSSLCPVDYDGTNTPVPSSSIPIATNASPSIFAAATSASAVTSAATSVSNSTTAAVPSSVVVAPQGGQFTALSEAISYAQAQGIPTVTVKAGTYTQPVTVSATPSVTVVGETAEENDYAQNQVTVSAASPLTISVNVQGITFKNINFVNTATGNTGAATIRGSQNAFYQCQFVSAGSLGITASLGLGVIANSYIEALDKVIYGYPGLYVYNTTIVPVNANALLVYSRGATDSSVLYNSTVVFDSCSVQPKSSSTAKNIYLAAANAPGSVVIYRDTDLASFIAATGVHVDSTTQGSQTFYGEYGTTGAGSYSRNTNARSSYVSLLESSDLDRFTLSALVASVYPQFASGNTDWVDKGIVAAIKTANIIQTTATSTSASGMGATTSSGAVVPASSLAVSPSKPLIASAMSATTSSHAGVPASSLAASHSTPLIASAMSATTSSHAVVPPSSLAASHSTPVVSSSAIAPSSSVSSTASCMLPSSVPTSALVVGPSGSCAKYTSIASAVAALPSDSTTQYVYILAGTYEEAIIIGRTGATVFRGESDSPLNQTSNKVTIVHSAALLSSQGGAASTAAFQATQYYAKGLSFYNINFENHYAATQNHLAAALAVKAQTVGFYGCGIKSSQGSLLINYGAFYFSDCRIEGTTDFIWGYGGIYVYNSRIVSDATTTGQTIAAQSYQGQYGPSQFVFDMCAFVPSDRSVPQGSVYLGRDYSTSSRVAVLNSYLDAHIAPVGWLVSAATTNVTFAESNNSGPGASVTKRSSHVQLLSDAGDYSTAGVLGSTSWIDTAAVAPFTGFPASVYNSSVSTPPSTTANISSTFIVSQNATAGQYSNVTAAIAALPNDGQAYTIYIKPGTYTEQLSITRAGKVTLRGETSFENDYTQNLVTIQFSRGELTSAGLDEITPVINAKKTDGSGLALYNINFVNTYPQTRNTAALAADFYGSNMAAYGCSFVGFQDTLLANMGTQVFSNCYIEGSVDFIWGYSTAYFHQCYIATNTPGTCIAAQSRPSSTAAGGYVFDSCYVTYTSSYGSTYGRSYLGRPYSQYSIAVYMNSYLDKHISSAGWNIWSTSSPNTDHVTFGEYNNSGPGAWNSGRASFATNLTATQAASYTMSSWIGDTSWLDMTAYNYIPSYNLSGSSTTSNATSTASWTHPTSGTVPPSGAVLVSPGGTVNGSYSNLTAALASLPADRSTQVIFMYPGLYNEQVPSIKRNGPVMVIGYQTGNPGEGYSGNQVTVSFSRGLSVSPLQPGHSNAETATLAIASNQVALYNINIINTANLDGSQPSYVALAGSIYGSQIAFYGCSFVGWQDTLLTGSTTGYQYYESSYIEGAIDFIWGYSKAYFKGCTIGAKNKKSAITAQSRASSTAVGGYIFDQCLFDAAANATVDLTQSVFLGRPYSKYALVVVKNSYLTDIINPSGWKIWSTSDPRTDYVTFAEYNNSGPGRWEANAVSREAFGHSTLLTSDTYTLSAVMDSTDWIDLTYWNSIVTPQPALTTLPSNTSTVYDGTAPPAGAYIVSKTPIVNVTTYSTIQSALDALPITKKVTPTVFIYPGTYEEQLVISRPGTTILMGYSKVSSDYTQNQVTIQSNTGVNTKADQSNSDSATVYATGNYLQASNINFVNNFGTTKDYASLGFAVKSSKYASLYGCQVTGNQDALLINGYFFASNSYIEGNIDMIWGSGTGYFLNSTIAPNKDGISLTADKRTTSTTAGGFVFDQCTITPTANAGTLSKISLGRPWNSFARVAYVKSYLGSCIEPAGWEQWSSSSPQTDGVLFGEYANYGPGSSTGKRASFATQLDASTVAQFELSNFFASTSWINFALVDATPFVPSNTTIVIPTPTPASTALTAPTPVVKTVVVTDKETAYTTMSQTDKTSTVMYTTTEDAGTTVTPAAVFKTTTQQTTVSSTVTITAPTVTSTKVSVVTDDIGKTITPPPRTKTTALHQTSTIMSTVTKAPSTLMVKSTVTVASIVTKAAKPVTSTTTVGETRSSIKTSTPRAVSSTSIVTVTVGHGGTTTVSAKETKTTIDVTSTITKTKTITTTLSCIPAKKKRDLIQPRAAAAATITDYTTFTTFVKTSTVQLAASTDYVTLSTTKTTGKPSTLKPTTSTITTLLATTKVSTEVIPAVTTYVTTTSTETIGKTSTLRPSTTIITATSLVTKTAYTTVEGAVATSTSLETTTVKSTVELPRSTVTVTKSAVVTVKSTVTLATPTITVVKTTTISDMPSVTITSRATRTATRIVKATVTESHTITKTSKHAGACPTA